MQTESIDLVEQSKSDRAPRMFKREGKSNSLLDSDGLPYVGQVSLFSVYLYFHL